MSESILHATDVKRSFDDGVSHVDVLKGVNMSVQDGEIIALTGASGVGKSTLLHLLGGLDRPTSGDIRYKNQNLPDMTDEELAVYRNQSIGFVFQFHHLLPEFTALENIAMPLLIRRNSREYSYHLADQMIHQIGLSARKDHKPSQLSGGEQQRVALARAIVTSPSIVLADEPTGNLDEDTAASVFDLIKDLNHEYNIAFVIATHNLTLARSAHRWLRFYEGKIEPVNSSELLIAPPGLP